jgi:hypothetical protein
MKNMQWKFRILAMVALVCSVVLIQSCDEEDPILPLDLASITAGGVDLNGATSATNVPVDASIEVEFSTTVDESTANADNIKLTRSYDELDVAVTIETDGATVTINPDANLTPGALYILTISEDVKSTQGVTLEALERNFTTAGAFAPDGAVAHWTFEDNANDVIGTMDPTANGIVAITYGASHNTAAGKAAVFNGTTSIIEIPNGDDLMETNNFTLSLWVKADEHSDDVNKGHFVLGLGAFYGFRLEIGDQYREFGVATQYTFTKPGTAPGFFAENNTFNGDGKNKDNGGWRGFVFTKDLTGSGGVAGLIKAKWAHIVYTYNATTKQGIYYVNGEKMRELDFDLWLDDAGAPWDQTYTTGVRYHGSEPDVVNELTFGFIHSRAGTLWDAEPWGGYDIATSKHFKGSLDDVMIYHKVISEAEALLMYNSGKP